ncbi:MAG: HPF/RaiA family ribosome-associated protein [Roseovarius sp.]
METPIEIVFHHVEPFEEIKRLIHEKADKLDQNHDRITSCRDYVKAPHQSGQTGNLYEVSLEVRVPGTELVVRQGKVVEIQQDKGFGQLTTIDGRVICLHENSVVGSHCEALEPCDMVELAVGREESPVGLKASTVRRVGALEYLPARKPSRR